MNVFNNVSTQVSGLSSSLGSWFKKEGKEGESPADGTVPVPEETSSTNISDKSVKGSADGNEDATSQHSGATEGADSNPPSPAEEDKGKAGFASAIENATQVWEGLGFNLSGVSSRASASAKTVGSFFSTAFSKAGASVKEAGSRIKETVEKNSIVSEFNKEQDAFIAAKGGKIGEALAPWIGYPQEESLKDEIMALSTDRRNFVRSPPTGVLFEFDLEQFLPVAQATLALDANLEKMRFELVPKTVTEENFWRNYFYRVGLIRQSTELSSLEKDQPQQTDTSIKSDAEIKESLKEEFEEHSLEEHEFVSDTFVTAEKEFHGLKTSDSPKTNLTGDEHWEKELEEELGGADLDDYEVVGGRDDKMEQELQNMIDEEDTDLR